VPNAMRSGDKTKLNVDFTRSPQSGMNRGWWAGPGPSWTLR